MSDIFLNGELKGVCSEELAEAIGLWIGQKDASIAELKAENARLKEAAQAHIAALTKLQYSTSPPEPWPDIAPTANALTALLEASDE